jgi:hypothetical protein
VCLIFDKLPSRFDLSHGQPISARRNPLAALPMIAKEASKIRALSAKRFYR